jgi:hypothetical protein
MNHYFRVFSISAALFFLLNSILMQSVAEPGASIVFTKEEQKLHIEKMKSMTPEQRAKYRVEQYALLRNKAAAIGYDMPATPPWENKTVPSAKSSSNASSDDVFNTSHKHELDKYRKDANEKRKEMHERLEKQRQHIKQRIATLVERHAVKPANETAAPPTAPAPMQAPVTNYPGGAFYPPPQTLGPNYPRYYPIPPAPPRYWGYPY